VRARRLRRVLSLLVQLAIFAAILLAAADPRIARAPVVGRTIVILIDRSASMAARDEPGGRIARAKAAARAGVGGRRPEDRAAILTFAGAVTTETGFDSDRARLAAAIDAVTASDEPGDAPAALAAAAARLGGRPRPTLILIGDGGGLPNGD